MSLLWAGVINSPENSGDELFSLYVYPDKYKDLHKNNLPVEEAKAEPAAPTNAVTKPAASTKAKAEKAGVLAQTETEVDTGDSSDCEVRWNLHNNLEQAT